MCSHKGHNTFGGYNFEIEDVKSAKSILCDVAIPKCISFPEVLNKKFQTLHFPNFFVINNL